MLPSLAPVLSKRIESTPLHRAFNWPRPAFTRVFCLNDLVLARQRPGRSLFVVLKEIPYADKLTLDFQECIDNIRVEMPAAAFENNASAFLM